MCTRGADSHMSSAGNAESPYLHFRYINYPGEASNIAGMLIAQCFVECVTGSDEREMSKGLWKVPLCITGRTYLL